MTQSLPHVTHTTRRAAPASSSDTLWDDSSQHWRLDQPMRRTRTAELYRARPADQFSSNPNLYVIKRLCHPADGDRQARRAIATEALVGRSVSHPHLVPVLGQNTQTERPFIVMPWIEGMPLDEVLASAGGLPVPHALWIARQTADALLAVHRAGWIHGDVKPANIIVSTSGHATLLDLGSVLPRNESVPSWERPVVGTLAYVAPELLTLNSTIDVAADIYSLGASLFEMLTAQLPFQHTQAAEIARAHLHQRPANPCTLLAHIPAEVGRLVQQLMAKDPLRRADSIDAVIDQLAALELDTLDMRWTQPRMATAMQVRGLRRVGS